MRFLLSRTLSLALLVALISGALAQNPASKTDGTWLNLKTNVGSFKILGAGERLAEGSMVMSFTGTVLVSGLEGTIVPTGNVKREINHEKRGKQVFFGTGKLVIKGKFRGLQWFGRNLSARFDGFGAVRLYGEFDRDLNTGLFWYGNKGEKKPWGTGGLPVTSTPRVEEATPKPRVKDVGKGGGS